MTWNWNGRLVSAGGMKVYDDPRLEVVQAGRELRLKGVTRQDRGEAFHKHTRLSNRQILLIYWFL